MLKKISFIVLANLLLFIFLEFSLKTTLKLLNKKTVYEIGNISSNNYDYLTGYYNVPNTEETLTPTYRQATDKYGFSIDGERKEKDLTIKKDHIFRIFILGGSTVIGHNLKNKYDPISARLEKKLNAKLSKKNLKYEVINAGTTSFFSGQEFSLIEKKIVYAMKPDYIIVLNGTNDYGLPFESEIHLSNSHFYQREFQKQFNKSSQNFFYFSDDWLSKNISLYFIMKKSIEKITGKYLFEAEFREKKYRNKDKISQEIITERKMYRYIYNIKRVSEIATKETYVSYFFQPQMLPKNIKDHSKNDRDKYNNMKAYDKEYFPKKQLFYDLAVKEIKNLNKTDKMKNNKYFQLIDISETLNLPNNSKNFYSDHVHYNELSREIIAESIFKNIETNIRSMKKLN